MGTRIGRGSAWALVVLACITTGGAASSADAVPGLHVVIIEGLRFEPPVLRVKRGDRVQWVNRDLVPHTVTAADKSFDSGQLAPAAAWKLDTREAGTYRYGCSLHPTMAGTLIVQ